MTTSDTKVLHRRDRALDQASIGAQNLLILAEGPAGTSALVGKPLLGEVLTIDGDYVFLIPTAGLASTLMVHFKATLNSMTVDSSGPDELAIFDPTATAVADAIVLTAGTGDGSVSTATLQTASLSLTGARYARYTLTLAGTPTSVTVTVAEYTGL